MAYYSIETLNRIAETVRTGNVDYNYSPRTGTVSYEFKTAEEADTFADTLLPLGGVYLQHRNIVIVKL